MAVADVTPDDIVATLRRHSKRVTSAKRAVATALLAGASHQTADEITGAVQRSQPDVSPSTVYRILDEFEALGIVVHTHIGQSAAVFHLASDRHAHLTCDACGRTVEIPAAALDGVRRTLQSTYGFALDCHHVALAGICADCGGTSRA